MTIRTKLTMLTFFPLALAVIAVAAIFVSSTVVEREVHTDKVVNEILKGTFELNFVLDSYLSNREKRDATQWELKHASLQRLTEGLVLKNARERAILERIRDDCRKLGLYFKRLTVFKEKTATASNPVMQQAGERVATAILVRSRDMFSSASKLVSIRREHMETTYQRSSLITAGILASIAAAVAIVSYTSSRSIRRSILALRQGAEEVSAGNLRHRVSLPGKDEFASFAETFNDMTAKVERSHDQLRALAASLAQENQERLAADHALKNLNADLERHIEEKTSELIKANRLLESARQHADRLTFQARMQTEQTRQYQQRLEKVIEIFRHILCAETMEALLQQVVEGVRKTIGADYCLCGHGTMSGSFRMEISSRSEDAAPCPPGRVFAIERGGVYMDIIESKSSIRLTESELLHHPRWWGLPEGHAPLHGLLGAPILTDDDNLVGIIMVSNKMDGEFTHEDEALLNHIANLTSIGIANTVARRWQHPPPQECRELTNNI